MFLGRKLAEGVAGWMMHEFHCDRSELFSEKYLSVPIGQILSAEFGTKVYSEVDHPILSTMAVGAGRRPQIDFAILDPYPKIKVVDYRLRGAQSRTGVRQGFRSRNHGRHEASGVREK
jgi:hypothetical protein